jgi:hypothetical protein
VGEAETTAAILSKPKKKTIKENLGRTKMKEKKIIKCFVDIITYIQGNM